MNPLKKIFPLLLAVGLLYAGWRAQGWMGLAFISGGLLLYVMLHVNRLLAVFRRAANRPIGYVPSAVMLNARLKPKVTLLHVIALTRSLGERRSPDEVQPEVFRWSDEGGSYVDATFAEGKLVQWQLTRPPVVDDAAAADSPVAAEAGAAAGAERGPGLLPPAS